MRTTKQRITDLIRKIPKEGERFVIDHITALFEVNDMEIEILAKQIDYLKQRGERE